MVPDPLWARSCWGPGARLRLSSPWQKKRGQHGPGQLARLGRCLAVGQLLVMSWSLPERAQTQC